MMIKKELNAILDKEMRSSCIKTSYMTYDQIMFLYANYGYFFLNMILLPHKWSNSALIAQY